MNALLEVLKAAQNLQCRCQTQMDLRDPPGCKELLQVMEHYVSPRTQLPPALQLQETLWQMQFFAKVPAPELLGNWCILWLPVSEDYFYTQNKLGHTWTTMLSIDIWSYWEQQKWQHWSLRMKFVTNKKMNTHLGNKGVYNNFPQYKTWQKLCHLDTKLHLQS